MQKCYFSPKHTKERWIGIICSLFVSITLSGVGVFTLLTTEDRILSSILIFLGMFFILYGMLFDLYMSREYELSENGIFIRYAKKKTVFFSWVCISQICICVIHQGKVEGIKDDVIWCTVGKIKNGPPNMARRWNEINHGIHTRKIKRVQKVY